MIFVFWEHTRGVDFPAGMEVSIGVIIMAVMGYAHDFILILIERLKKR